MNKLSFPRMNEVIYHEQLPNGLDIFILPKEGFRKVYATFSTKYGSIDHHFQVGDGEEIKVPDGIAHFLEHKMFAEPTGDVFHTFSTQGASANAFTSFDRTVYLFSATDHISENIQTLINFVQNPYFTEENIEKEKGIIEQEIKMYQDHPDWCLYYGLIEAMYHHHPIHIDIAGTVESISKITKETLYDCYHTFYHPSNMNLFVVGGIDPVQIMNEIKGNQAKKTFSEPIEIKRFFPEEPGEVKEKIRTKNLTVSQPKCLFGFKAQSIHLNGADLLKHELTMKLIMDGLFGQSSDIYQTLYDEKLITDQFSHDYSCGINYGFSVVGGDTPSPERLLERVKQLLTPVLTTGLHESVFERSRRKRIGSFLRMLNSPEAIANEYGKYRFRNTELFDVLPQYERITLDEANELMRTHFDWEQLAVSIVRSNGS